MKKNSYEKELASAGKYLESVVKLEARYRAGEIHVNVPAGLKEPGALDDLVQKYLPASHAALAAASMSLFYSLPVAFDPAQSIGPYLAVVDRDAKGEPYRFMDMGALIATHGFGENDPSVVASVLEHLPYVVARYAHSEYQTALSLKLKAKLADIAPKGTPRHFVVNTGAEAVENAIKAVLLNRVKTAGEVDGGFIVSFDGAFHGRTLGALAVTHRKKARLGFPTFDWPKAPFPTDDPQHPAETARREERSLKTIWEYLVSGKLPGAAKSKETFKAELAAIDDFLVKLEGLKPEARAKEATAFVAEQRAKLSQDVVRRARRAAAVLVEPIQGEGGVRTTTPRFMQRLRLLTRIYDVPLVFDEVQAGWGTAGKLWAHELFDLPLPPDVVTWAKKAQNGVLFVSDDLATFFQEEKKFNTTWEGDSVGMARLLAMLPKLDLEQVRRTGVYAKEKLEQLQKDYPELIQSVRGFGVMLAFDVVRSDWRDALRDRAFRMGLILLPAGERVLRFYPRYDSEKYVIDEAVAILRAALDDLVQGRAETEPVLVGPEVRMGCLDCPIEAVEPVELTHDGFDKHRAEVMNVEVERYGQISQYPKGVLKSGRRPLLQYQAETLEATLANPRAIGIALRDTVAGKLVAYGLGSPIENHDEEGVRSDPHHGENNTFYLQALATLPSVQNQVEVENHLLELLGQKAATQGFEYFSALIEERLLGTGPKWLREATVTKRIDNYLRSGIRFAYLSAPLVGAAFTIPERLRSPSSAKTGL